MRRGPSLLPALLLLFIHCEPLLGNLHGEPQYCRNEGAHVKVPSALVGENSCLMCFCKNHMVQCTPLGCPSLDGCYRVMRKTKPECCSNCLGCIYKGKKYNHGQIWMDQCRVHECQAGILTTTHKQCHVPCRNPLPPKDGECCPRCEGCWLGSTHVAEGATISSQIDPCVKCLCLGGKLTCSKRACPVLACPPSKTIKDSDGCCHVCNGSRQIYVPPGLCFLGSYLYRTGQNRTVDDCSNCTCNQGYLTCEKKTCPPLNCPEEYAQNKTGECCPFCSYQAHTKICSYGGVQHKHGDVWRLDKCTSCNCSDGMVSCSVDQCEYLTKECPPGSTKKQFDNDCCPRCVEGPGVCVVYGEPHFKTFDNHFFDFQGECRYELVKDCTKSSSFSILLNNDARQSVFYPWARSLTFKFTRGTNKYKVYLSQKLRTKVNHKRVKLPFYDRGLNITRKGFLLTLVTETGILINWDGAGYIEVKLDSTWQKKTCGLCGNFNKNSSDDKLMKNGKLASTNNAMANSWQSGKTRSCYRRLKRLRLLMHRRQDNGNQIRTQRLTCPSSQAEIQRRCGILNGTYFSGCKGKIPLESFYKSCIMDLCECPTHRKCECDSIVAYARECERANTDMAMWKVHSKCGGLECPFGSVYMKCAPACKPSCRNPTPNPNCYMRRCRPGCYCPPPTVLHRGTCVLPKNFIYDVRHINDPNLLPSQSLKVS